MIEKDTGQLEELLYKILPVGNIHRKLMGEYIDAGGFQALIEKPYRLHLTCEIDRRLKALHEIAESLRLRDFRGEYVAAITYLTGISRETQLAFGRRYGLERLLEAPKTVEASERQTKRLMLVAEFMAYYLAEDKSAVLE
ncbi:hypothetical protein [Lacrimispora sp. 38-1]|uniref:hypothetical protein n=1 Tax=Lacrimispora sp. 38-1 TaxID=3125778 RepID=UPI003CF20E29